MLKKCLLLAILFLMAGRILAQEEKYISLYLQNFTRYIEWPEEKRTNNFVIETLGHVSVYEKLKERFDGKEIYNQPVTIRNFKDAEEIGEPHIMFVGHWQSQQMPEVMDKLEGQATLIVTEKEGMIDEGAAINFVIKEGKIKFEFKKNHARERGLSVNSRLEQLGIPIE
ncbi:MAG: YfiR family protein [Bacteroidota bacterium]